MPCEGDFTSFNDCHKIAVPANGQMDFMLLTSDIKFWTAAAQINQVRWNRQCLNEQDDVLSIK
jgi:hypothetical protein